MEEHDGRALACLDDMDPPTGANLDVPALRGRHGEDALVDGQDLIGMPELRTTCAKRHRLDHCFLPSILDFSPAPMLILAFRTGERRRRSARRACRPAPS